MYNDKYIYDYQPKHVGQIMPTQNQDTDYYRYLRLVQDGLNVADRVFDFAGEADQRRIRELQAQAELENARNQRYANGGTVEATDIVPTLLLVVGGVLVTVLLFKAFKD